MVRLGVRRAALAAALMTMVQGVLGAAGPAAVGAAGPAAAADCDEPKPIYAVNGSNGYLYELASCPDSLTEVGKVDSGDWRTSSRIFATGDVAVTVVYRITADGRLEARRQTASGAQLEAPVEVGAGIDWSRFRTVIVPRRGYLWADDGVDRTIRAFRHDGWATGGTAVVEGKPVINMWPDVPTGSPELIGLSTAGHAEAIGLHAHWRMWDRTGDMYALTSGTTTSRLTGAEGTGLYAAEPGAVSELTQPYDDSTNNCPVNGVRWQVRTRLPGDWWSQVAVPQRTPSSTGWPAVKPFPTVAFKCPPGTAEPYQWQR
jgi:hypothetical protein